MDSDFGARVHYWRTRRRMTRATFAALMGRSLRWVEELEGGRRQADPQLSVIRLAALRLGVSMDRLVGEPFDAECAALSEIDAVRQALHRHDVITGTSDDGPALPVAQLEQRLFHARTGFYAGHFAQLSSAIPELLVESTRATERHRGADQLRAYGVLALVLDLTEAASIKWGDAELALLAGHRAAAAAERSANPVVMASAARHLADAMTAHGQPEPAGTFALASADRLHDDLLRAGPTGVSVLGMLHLKAALAAAAAAEADDQDPGRFARQVPAQLDQAAEHADRLGRDDNLMWTSFGPTNVRLYRVAAAVQLSEGDRAVSAADDIPAEALAGLPRERRAHLLTDRAHGEMQAGLRGRAVDTLIDAERLAPEEVQCRPRTRTLVEGLRLTGTGTMAADTLLRGLSERCGLPG
ncbi:XRE family transcriptional regulator [Streptomyces jumonjinensis]|uniref:XRE family transcriptional regulator n=1 Tax=Streptomyces jumonjinensis TaxID=1945 RepID=UPI00378ECA11